MTDFVFRATPGTVKGAGVGIGDRVDTAAGAGARGWARAGDRGGDWVWAGNKAWAGAGSWARAAAGSWARSRAWAGVE